MKKKNKGRGSARETLPFFPMTDNHPQMPFKDQCILLGKLLIIWIIAALVQAL
jgi:hypothetical protein